MSDTLNLEDTDSITESENVAKKIYESDNATVWCGDSKEVLKYYKNQSIECLITDPPYGVNFQSSKRKEKFSKITGDMPEDSLNILQILSESGKKVVKTGHCYIFGVEPSILSEYMLFSATADLVWNKEIRGMGNLHINWAPSHERITFGVQVHSQKNRERGDGSLSARKRQGSVLSVPRFNSGAVKRHPTEKPVELITQLVESSTVVGDTVLDPFAGSGSTAVAATLLGRKSISIEIDEKYSNIIVQRIQKAERIREQMLSC